MRLQAAASCLLLALLTGLLSLGEGKIHYTHLNKDDRKLVPLTEAFGFSEGGTISIEMTGFNRYEPFDQEVKVGCLLKAVKQELCTHAQVTSVFT